eukprot:Pgem_evm1s5770
MATIIQSNYRAFITVKGLKKLKKRGFVVRELIDTERSYVTSLRTLYQFYIKPLIAAAGGRFEYNKLIIEEDEITQIFCNAPEIYDIHL